MANLPSPSGSLGGAVVAEALMVTSPLYRLALAAFVALGLGVVAWGLFGSVPNRIEGFGEIITKTGLHSVPAPAVGQVAHIDVHYGERVAKGQLLMRLDQPELQDQIDATDTEVQSLQSELDILRTGDKQSSDLREQVQSLERQRLSAQLKQLDSQVAYLKDELDKQRELFKKGIIIQATVQDSEQALASAKVSRDQTQESIRSLSLDSQQWQVDKEMNEKVKANQLVNLQKQLDNLHDQYKRNTEVRSEHDGRIIEMNTTRGAVVQRGTPLVVVEEERSEADYQFDLYVPYSANNRITKGMRVDVELLTVDHNVYGWLIGDVREVTDYVSTDAELQDNLQNDALAGKIKTNGPVFRVVVQLKKDRKTASGFAWTDHKGPPFRINVGSLGNAYVHVSDKAPVDYLIPIFNKYFD